MTQIDAAVDPAASVYMSMFGRKRSGKSFLARRFWDTYPFDSLVIDVNADIDDDEARLVRASELPGRFPGPLHRGERVKLRYVPDPGSPTYRDDLDRAVGLVFRARRKLLWIDEVGDLTNANSTPPYMARALHQGRHRELSMLMCGPRPVDINPLVISQSDYVYVFDLPHPRDRERVAAVIGYPPRDFDEAIAALGPHCYLRWDAEHKELIEFPPIRRAALDREARFAGA